MMNDCCKRPKNPCMVCRRTVTNKTGLQCQGSCKSWIHYACCSYTPGKIKDIKAKIIKVRCPCPDCTPSGVPKEEVVKEDSFSCLNQKCPVNTSKCQNHECPLSKVSQLPSGVCSSPKEWPGMPCGTACKKNSSPTNLVREPSIGDRRSGSFSPRRTSSHGCPPRSNQAGSTPCCMPSEPVMPSVSVVEKMCETVGMLSNQLNQLMCKMTVALNPKGNKPGSPCFCPQNPRRT